MRINLAVWSLLVPTLSFAACGDATDSGGLLAQGGKGQAAAGGLGSATARGGATGSSEGGAGAVASAGEGAAPSEAGAGGSIGAGGSLASSGGTGIVTDAGASGSGGELPAGGTTSGGSPNPSGGASNQGGSLGAGGSLNANGGAVARGGSLGAGGSLNANGGAVASGGSLNASGGAVASGGLTGTGGSAVGSGGSTSASGGSAPGSGGAATVYGLDQRPSNSTCLAPARNAAAATLKASGCTDSADATKPAAGLIPYAVNSPLWSDGAQKERWLALPDSGKIHINADGDWDLPNGTVLMKTFWVAGKRVETRLFVREANGTWSGYTYAWNDAQTDATLLPDATSTTQVGSQTWLFPSRKQCSDCHRQVAGFSLGLETGQLNGEFTYPNGRTANQLATFDKIGLFDAPLAVPAASAPRFPTPTLASSGSLEGRSKAYVHANCSHCHRPGGVSAPFDMRYQTAFGQMGLCNVTPQNSGFGSFYVSPGVPNDSAILGHMLSTGKQRMPPLATSIVDAAGTQVISDWITSLRGCP